MNDIVGRYVEVRGKLTYLETGGSGPHIVLLHSAGRETRQWHGVIRALAPFYTLTALDLPGHGKSYPLEGNKLLSDIFDIADWISECTSAAFDNEKYAVMGCSIGGNLSLLMAALYPERVVASIALQGADHTPSIPPASLEMLLHPMLNPLHGSMEFSRSLIGSQAVQDGRDFMMWTAETGDPITRYHDLGAYTRCDIRHLMDRVTCPVLLIHGSEDWIVPRARMDETAGRLVNVRQCTVQSMPGIGHAPHVEAPDLLVETIMPFLREVM